MWGLISLMIVGLIAGAIAKALMRGDRKEPRGCLLTMLLGMAGAVLFGFMAQLMLGWTTSGNFLGQVVAGTIGAVIIIALARALSK